MIQINSNLFKNSDKLIFILIAFLPLSLFFGSAIINIFVVFTSILFILKIIKKNYLINKNIIFLLSIFILSLILNSIFISKFSTEAIASKIRKISSISLAERINRGKLINSLVVKNFSINNYAKNLLNIYNKNV